jgi:ABC-type nitrate/sulfonate/bicarbonate transport system substrate-binding protein
VVFSIRSNLVNYPPVLALESGHFERARIRARLVPIGRANESLQALLSGDVTIDASLPFTLVFEVERRSPGTLKCFGAMIATPERPLETVLVRVADRTATFEQLSAARIGVEPGSFTGGLTRLLLGEMTTLVPVRPQQQLEALVRGDVDAIVTYDPWTAQAVREGTARPVTTGIWEEEFGAFAVAGYCVTTKTLRQREAAVARVQSALSAAVREFEANPRATVALLAPYFSLQPDIADAHVVPRIVFGSELTASLLQHTYDVYRRAGIIEGDIDPTAVIANPTGLSGRPTPGAAPPGRQAPVPDQ